MQDLAVYPENGQILETVSGFLPTCRNSIQQLDLKPEDQALVQLVYRYALTIDDAHPGERVDVLAKLGPKLLDALRDLGATPRSRSDKGGAPGNGSLTALRAARQ